MHRFMGCMAIVVLLSAGNIQAEVVVSDAYHSAYVYDGYTDSDSEDYTDAVDSTLSADLNATLVDGSARTQLNRSPTSLNAVLTHLRPSSLNSFSQSSGWDVFTVDVPTWYSISGVYGMIGAGAISLAADLYDITNDAYLFDNGQTIVKPTSSPNQTFLLGGTAGDDPYLEGSLMGTLEPGVEYQFSYKAFIWNSPDDYGTASATGNVLITMTAVPEPSTLISCVTLALFGAVWIARRRRGR